MVLRCMTESVHSPQYIVLHRRPVGDWYKFASGPARHLHTSWYKRSNVSKLSTYRPLDKASRCTSESRYFLPRSPPHHFAEGGWYKLATVPAVHLHKWLYKYSNYPRRPTFHQLDTEAADKIWFLYRDRNMDCHRKPEKDWYKFAVDLECHLHMSLNMNPTYPIATTFR